MSLKKIFIFAAVVIAVVFLLASSAYYLIAKQQMASYAEEDLHATAKGVISGVTNLVKQLDNTVTIVATNSKIIQLYKQNNSGALATESEHLSTLTPALRIRLLQPDENQPDESSLPFMGFADLVLVRDAVNSDPKPAVVAIGTAQSHIALARKVIHNDRVIGVVLGSFSSDGLIEAINGVDLVSGRIELKQGELSIANSGDGALMDEAASGELLIAETDWTLLYWKPQNREIDWLPFSIIGLSALLLAVLPLFLVFRKIASGLKSDQKTLVRLVKDMLTMNKQGRYPVELVELEETTEKLLGLKPYVSAVMVNEEGAAFNEGDDVSSTEKASSKTSLKAAVEVQVPAAIFKAYDIRGIVEDTLTPKLVSAIGRAFGSEAYEHGQQAVIIARDGRLSSAELSDALIKGLQNSGRKVIDIGMVPTPVLYFATHFFELETSSGIMVTGSHNPANYNGLKLVLAGETLSGEQIQKLKKRIESQDFSSGSGTLEKREILEDYLRTITGDIDIGREMKVVVDCGNGVAGPVAPKLLKRMGCDVIELHCDVDGDFPNHHPDPSKPENLQDLVETVLAHNADLGIAFDGDGDRLGVVDSSGTIIWPDRQMMLYAADVLSREPGADIIFDVKCTRNLASEIAKQGGRPLMWKSGHSLIKAKMKETGAALAGEMSGHIFFKERWYGFDDGIYASARLLEILAIETENSAEIFKALPDMVNTPELNVPLEEGEALVLVEKMKKIINFPKAKIIDLDGLRIEFPGGWGLVRASNTTPSLVMRFEAKDEKALKKLQGIFRELILKVKPNIQLPF